MASIFGRRQKPSPTKTDNRVSNANPKGVDALMTGVIEENGTNGLNGESDYHKNGRNYSFILASLICHLSSLQTAKKIAKNSCAYFTIAKMLPNDKHDRFFEEVNKADL